MILLFYASVRHESIFLTSIFSTLSALSLEEAAALDLLFFLPLDAISNKDREWNFHFLACKNAKNLFSF